MVTQRKSKSQAGLSGANKRWHSYSTAINQKWQCHHSANGKLKRKLKLNKNDDTCVSLLSSFLTEDQINKIINLFPDITKDYIKEKIELMNNSTKPIDNKAAFLYSALIYNYQPPAKPIKSKPTPHDHFESILARQGYLDPEQWEQSPDSIKSILQLEDCINGEKFYFKKNIKKT